MRKPVVLITGANGEIGHGLVEHFGQVGAKNIVAMDIKPFDERLSGCCTSPVTSNRYAANPRKLTFRNSEVWTDVLPLARKKGDMSASANSRAMV